MKKTHHPYDILFFCKKRKFNFEIAEKPVVKVPDETITKGFDALNDKLFYNLMPPVGRHSDVWARPASLFPSAYLWDSAFISQAWKIWDPTVGLKILKPFIEFQSEDGRMPHYVLFGKFTSSLSNPPFLAWAVKNLLDHLEDPAWAEFFVPPLLKFIKWRKENRYNEEHGLYFWIDSYESGIDNTPRFRSVDESEEYSVSNLGSIDLCSEIILQHRAVLDIIDEFNLDVDKTSIEEQTSDLLGKIQDKLWDPDKQLFGDLDLTTGELKTIDTIASYFPLVMPGLDKEKEACLIENLENPVKYNTQMPTPTVARDSPDFIKDMWRGPVWMNTSYLIVQGLMMKGYEELAGDFAYRLCKGVYETWKNKGNFYEFYDPDRYDLKELDRKKGNLKKAITLGTKPVKHFAGWTALANTLLVENVIGLRKEKQGWTLQPQLPGDWLKTGNEISVKTPFHDLELTMIVANDDTQLECECSIGGEKKKVKVQNKERVEL
ncbi:MAG: trehalase family glycosidase [Candidatus Hodarchaeota archaeon]